MCGFVRLSVNVNETVRLSMYARECALNTCVFATALLIYIYIYEQYLSIFSKGIVKKKIVVKSTNHYN